MQLMAVEAMESVHEGANYWRWRPAARCVFSVHDRHWGGGECLESHLVPHNCSVEVIAPVRKPLFLHCQIRKVLPQLHALRVGDKIQVQLGP